MNTKKIMATLKLSHSYSRSQCTEIGTTSVRAPDPGLLPGPGSRPGTDVECPRPGNAPFRAPERFAVHSGPASGPRNAFRGPDPGRGPDPARIRGPALYSALALSLPPVFAGLRRESLSGSWSKSWLLRRFPVLLKRLRLSPGTPLSARFLTNWL